MTDDDAQAPDPDREAVFERLRSRAQQSIDPIVVGVLQRAVEVARRKDVPTVGLKEVLESFLHATITPGLIHHLQAARSISEDEQGAEIVYVDDLSVFAAALEAPTSVLRQVVEQYVDDLDGLIALVRLRVRDTPPSDDT